MSFVDQIVKLSKQLYPTGRAFKVPVGGELEKLHSALAISESTAFEDALSILDSALPDNENFTADDAEAWERRLGLVTNDAVSLSDRKAAIIRKMNHPGTIKARQHYLYLQGQLQAAGFNVFVHENRFDDGLGGLETRDPLTVSGTVGSSFQLGDRQLGDFQLGAGFTALIVNSIDPSIDAVFDVGANLRSTFFIGGEVVGTYADVDANRETEFRQLILKIKPAQTVGYLFINYI